MWCICKFLESEFDERVYTFEINKWLVILILCSIRRNLKCSHGPSYGNTSRVKMYLSYLQIQTKCEVGGSWGQHKWLFFSSTTHLPHMEKFIELLFNYVSMYLLMWLLCVRACLGPCGRGAVRACLRARAHVRVCTGVNQSTNQPLNQAILWPL